eukprot:Hpha_TRINITY_DN15377_c2_g12::TRINITY_DN15377_c2_g12_i1::g.88512::m.88512
MGEEGGDDIPFVGEEVAEVEDHEAGWGDGQAFGVPPSAHEGGWGAPAWKGKGKGKGGWWGGRGSGAWGGGWQGGWTMPPATGGRGGVDPLYTPVHNQRPPSGPQSPPPPPSAGRGKMRAAPPTKQAKTYTLEELDEENTHLEEYNQQLAWECERLLDANDVLRETANTKQGDKDRDHESTVQDLQWVKNFIVADRCTREECFQASLQPQTQAQALLDRDRLAAEMEKTPYNRRKDWCEEQGVDAEKDEQAFRALLMLHDRDAESVMRIPIGAADKATCLLARCRAKLQQRRIKPGVIEGSVTDDPYDSNDAMVRLYVQANHLPLPADDARYENLLTKVNMTLPDQAGKEVTAFIQVPGQPCDKVYFRELICGEIIGLLYPGQCREEICSRLDKTRFYRYRSLRATVKADDEGGEKKEGEGEKKRSRSRSGSRGSREGRKEITEAERALRDHEIRAREKSREKNMPKEPPRRQRGNTPIARLQREKYEKEQAERRDAREREYRERDRGGYRGRSRSRDRRRSPPRRRSPDRYRSRRRSRSEEGQLSRRGGGDRDRRDRRRGSYDGEGGGRG